MDSQNNFYCDPQQNSSTPRAYAEYTNLEWQDEGVPGPVTMNRIGSNDSASSETSYYSGETYYSNSSPASANTTLSPYGAGSPYKYEDSYGYPRYSQHPEQYPKVQRLHSDQYGVVRPTPTSLGWTPETILEDYKFVVKKGKEPYFELVRALKVTKGLPEKVYLDFPKNSQKNIFPCQYPASCEGTIFKRPADLERHYRNVHADNDSKEKFPCDYKRACTRVGEPFTRKDHFRDHLRDYHKEDLGCAKGEKLLPKEDWLPLQEAWVAERKIAERWWRCHKCLSRVHIATSRYECPLCKLSLEKERVERIEAYIEAVRQKAVAEAGVTMNDVQYDTAPTYGPNCSLCNDTAWIWNVDGGYNLCPGCQAPPIGQTYKVDEDWGNEGGCYNDSNSTWTSYPSI